MLEVYINKDFMTKRVDIYIFQRESGNKITLAKPVNLEFETIEDKPYAPLDKVPTLTLERYIADDFLNSLAKALQEVNVKVESDSVLKGKQEALEYHLEDMRTLLKLEKKK